MSIAKQIILDELEEQKHPEKVEDVIFWALKHYAKTKPKGLSWGSIIAKEIIGRIEEEESNPFKDNY